MDEHLVNASADKIELLVNKVLKGRKAYDVIISFHNWLFAFMHPSPPEDSNNDLRTRSTVFPVNIN